MPAEPGRAAAACPHLLAPRFCRFRKFCGSDSRNSAVRGFVRVIVVVGHGAVVRQVLRAHGRAIHTDESATLEDAVDDGIGEILVV